MSAARIWAVVPAAGSGSRMGAGRPKQYLELAGAPILQHTLARLLGHSAIQAVVVALSESDADFQRLPCARDPRLLRAHGGAERCHSVANALDVLVGRAAEHDWVLVHDAARPCLCGSDIDRLLRELGGHPVGGLLALPVRDTMKRADPGGDVTATVDRQGLWHALTPQMFRLGALRAALAGALGAGVLVTDEAQAMERTGVRPRLVEGRPDNIKVTRPHDLALAELYLSRQREESACA